MKLKSKIFYLYSVLVVANALLSLIPAPAKATLTRYHITATALRSLDISFIILTAVIWFAAFYGYQKLHDYGRLIKGNKDGKAVTKLSWGLLVLAIGSAAGSIISAIFSIVTEHHSSFLSLETILNNYIAVVFPLIAFLCISVGARGLSDLIKTRPRLRWLNVVVLFAVGLGTVFCYLIAHSHKDVRLAYHMPYGIVMLTLAIPYTYIWFLGLFALAEIQAYGKKVAGVVYRKSWNLLAFGLGSIILLSIVIQYLTTLSSWIIGLSLSWILLILYLFLLMLAAAYILVALGAQKLIKIEEV